MANFIPKIEYTEINTGASKSVNFTTPPEGDPFDEEFSANSTVTTSNNGQRQTAHNYNKKKYDLEFIFQSKAVKDAMQDFFINHAVKGGKFNYFIHNDEVEFEEFEIEGKKIKFDRPIPDDSGDFEYNFKFSISRVIG